MNIITNIYKLVKSTTSLVMHIISLAKALKSISHIYISYTIPKKYKGRMHEKFRSLHRGSYKANLLKNGRTRRRKKFLSRFNVYRVTHFRRSLSFRMIWKVVSPCIEESRFLVWSWWGLCKKKRCPFDHLNKKEINWSNSGIMTGRNLKKISSTENYALLTWNIGLKYKFSTYSGL